MAKQISRFSCSNDKCKLHAKVGVGNIRHHGYSKTKHGQRRRYICKSCGATFSSTNGSAYHRLRASRNELGLACQMSAEGVNISAIARTLKRSWNTINRWLERARIACCKFQKKNLRGYNIIEMQADEIKAFIDSRKKTTWIFTIIEVSSRLWSSIKVGSRSYRNIRKLFGEAFHNGV